MAEKRKRPEWLEPFEAMANEQLDSGSACHQVHPIVENWYLKMMTHEPPASRDSVLQAIACLSTELINDMPDEVFETLFDEGINYEDVVLWIQEVLMIGRAFQVALDAGEFDDL